MMTAVVYLAALVLLCLLALGFLLMVYIIYIFYLRRVKYAHIPGPPVKDFFKGHLNEMFTVTKRLGIHHAEFYRQCFVKYGEVFLIWIYHLPMVCISSPELAKYVLVTKNYPKYKDAYRSLISFYGERFLGSGLVTNMDNEDWKVKRRLINPAFHRKYLKFMIPKMNSCCDILIEKLLTMADGKTQVNMVNELNRLTLDVICKVGFGVDFNVILDETAPFSNAIETAVAGSHKAIFASPLDQIKFSASTEEREAVTAVKYLKEIARKVINEREEKLRNGEDLPLDLLSCILKSCETENETISVDSLIDELLTFFFAGHDTTASLLSFSIMEVNEHPAIEKKVVKEMKNVIGERSEVDFGDLAHLKYTNLIIKESLRLYPPVLTVSRLIDKDDVLGGYFIPGGTPVSISVYGMNHDPYYFDEPFEYKPERWELDETKSSSQYTSLPFSVGPRNCIGQVFSQIEAKVLLTRLLSKFKFSLVEGQTKRVVERIIVKPKDGVVCTLKPREDKESDR